ncbi:MAG: uroporphyrinogen decarboxylase family protein [Bacteroidota bacterium]
MKAFWATNERCRNRRGPRVPVSMHLDGDWICDYLKLDNAKYYSDFDYQQESRLRCSKITENELAYTIGPAVDFGVVMDASIYGGKVNYEENATPTLRPAVTDPAEIDALVDRMRQADLLEQGLIPKYLEWRERIKDRFGLTLVYGDGMKGCATMLGQICGITNFLTWIATDPEQIHKLVACWRETSERYIRAMRRATGFPEGRTGFSFASDVAGMLSPRLYQDFIRDAEAELYEVFAPNPGDKRFYHADYRMLHLLEILKGMGVNEVNVDPYVEPSQILAVMPDAVVYGQIPPTNVLLYGTPEEVIACAKRDIEQAGPGGHLVLTTAGSINPGTTFANLKAMCYAAEAYGYIYAE